MTLFRRTATLVTCLSCLALVSAAGPNAPRTGVPDPDLSPELGPLRPFVGSWIGHFDDPDETQEIFATWSVILGGHALREVRTVPDAGAFESETLYYFDRESATISFVGVANTGYVTRGQVTHEGGRFVMAGKQVRTDASVRSTQGTYTARDDGTLVNEAGHTIIFRRRQDRDPPPLHCQAGRLDQQRVDVFSGQPVRGTRAPSPRCVRIRRTGEGRSGTVGMG